MTIITYGIFKYLINEANNEALLGTINNTIITDHSANKNAFINPDFTSYNVVIPPTILYNNKYYFVKRIGVCAFRYSMITSLRIGKFVEEIQFRSLDWCSYLQKIEFDRESSLTMIGRSFAVNSSITKIIIPSRVNRIADLLFRNAKKLKTIYYGGSELECLENLNSSSISIYVLPNYKDNMFCKHIVTVLSEFPLEKIPSCIKYLKCFESISISYLLIPILF